MDKEYYLNIKLFHFVDYIQRCPFELYKKRRFILPLLSLTLLMSQISIAEELKSSVPAPVFNIKSGAGDVLTLNDVKGKVLIIFYETKEVKEKNRMAKDELNLFYYQQEEWIKALVLRLPVINCSAAIWPLTGIWRSKLRENSEKEKMIVYGDWDGSMEADFNMKSEDCNVVLVGRKGMIRYFQSGALNNEAISEIKEILKKLVIV